VLAIAILGAVALTAFRSALRARTMDSSGQPCAPVPLARQVAGRYPVPEGVDPRP
jgi:hypothetical protein